MEVRQQWDNISNVLKVKTVNQESYMQQSYCPKMKVEKRH